jgi:uncharacterized membrane protein YeiH
VLVVRAQQNTTGTKLYWLHSYCLVLLSGFGGGILAPVFLGQPSMMFVNNLLVLIGALAWYLTHYVPGAQEFFTSLPVKLVRAIVLDWIFVMFLFFNISLCFCGFCGCCNIYFMC